MSPKIRTILFNISALLLLAGACLYLIVEQIASYLFAFGAAGITICYLTMPTKEMDIRERRLHRYNIFSGFLCLCASTLMFKGQKEWIICLTISALLQVYTSFVIPKKKD